jgi:hypothetical protein
MLSKKSIPYHAEARGSKTVNNVEANTNTMAPFEITDR